MSPALQLILYCSLIATASLSGGWIPMVVRITHTRMQVAISLVAGVMLGVGLLHMIPHSFYELGKVDVTAWWVMIGFLVMFFLERFFHFHHHDAPDDAEVDEHEHCNHTHDHTHAVAHQHSHDHGASAHEFSWGGAFIGLALHSAVDGLALAAAVSVEEQKGVVPLLAGLGTFLAIFLHKPFDSLSIGTLMAAGGWSERARHIVNVAYALVLPVGVLIFMFGVDRSSHNYAAVLGRALGFAGGAFLCIATSDLLPELQFHSHDRTKLSVSLLLGVALAYAIGIFETHGHDHHGDSHGHQHAGSHSTDHDHTDGHDHGDDHDHKSSSGAGGHDPVHDHAHED